MDIGCGKGGDLRKYKIGRIAHLICTDIAETSLDQCKARYEEMKSFSSSHRGGNTRGGYRNNNQQQQHPAQNNLFTAEFIYADSTKERLKDKYANPNVEINMVSIQFSFHYCFESLAQAEMMIRNAAENLVPGGFLIGTTLDADDIVYRVRTAGGNEYKNDIFGITFKEGMLDSDERIPVFGAEYNFNLDEVVDCPEYLVHFPVFVKIAEKFGLKLLFKRRFSEYYEEKSQEYQGRNLLMRMKALESYPPFISSPVSPNPHDYDFANSVIEKLEAQNSQSGSSQRQRIGHGRKTVGTLSQSEWDVITLYQVFAFQKVGAKPQEVNRKRVNFDGNNREEKRHL